MERYSRQVVLPEVGRAGQEAIARAKVLVIGCGGLAAPVCSYLAAAGVGKIGLVDHDYVDESNLQRQTLFSESEVGELKVEAASRRLRSLARDLLVEAISQKFDSANAIGLVSGYDVLIDCTDNFSTKFLINDVAILRGLPLIFGTVTGFDGQFGVFDSRRGACFRCLYPSPPKTMIQSCQEAGVLGAAVGIVGSWQALECLKVILHRGGIGSLAPSYGTISVLDLRQATQTSFRVPERKGCLCEEGCEFSLGEVFSSECEFLDGSISWDNASKRTEAGFLDVREESEISEGRLAGARHWALSRLEKGEFPEFLPASPVWVVYCARGVRSRWAAELLRKRYEGLQIFSLQGGLEKI